MAQGNYNLVENVRAEIVPRYHPATQGLPGVQAQLSLADIWRTLVKRKFIIMGFTAFSMLIMAMYGFTRTSVYEGVARLQIDPMRSSSLGLDDTDKTTSPDVDALVKTEVEIIRSNTVAMQVMNALRLYCKPQFAGTDTVSRDVDDISKLTPAVQRRLLDRFNASLTVRVVPSTEIVEIRFRNSDPVLATDAANSIIKEYMQRNFQTRVDGAAQVSQWLSSQMEEIRQSTAISQQKLADFQRETGLLGTNESDNIVTDRLKQLNEELTQAEADRIIKEGRYRLAGSDNPELSASVVPTTTLQDLHSRQAELDAQYAALTAKYGSGYPKLAELQSQLAALSSAITKERGNIATRLANEYDAALKSETMIRDDFEKQKAQAYKLNEHATQYAILKHEVESGQQLYDTLQLKVKEAGVASGLKSSYVNVIDRAQLPDAPVEPRRRFYLAAGLGGGLVGGIFLGFILDAFDDTVETSEQLEALITLPVLGAIPLLAGVSGGDRGRVKGTNLRGLRANFDPVSVRDPHSMGAEAYRSLCSTVALAARKSRRQVLVVTSAMPGEGKSTVSANLATVLAQVGKRVLLVDADMRCSSIHAQLGMREGLSTMLGEEPCSHLLYQPLAELPTLIIVPAGARPTNPTEICSSQLMKDLVTRWRAAFDYIILDTPPVLPFADAVLISTLADSVILVARSEISRDKALLRAKELLLRADAKILGVVLNAVKRPEFNYAYPVGVKRPTGGDRYAFSAGSKS